MGDTKQLDIATGELIDLELVESLAPAPVAADPQQTDPRPGNDAARPAVPA